MEELLLGPLVGGLTSNSAYLWGRASAPGTLHAWLGGKPDLSDAQLAGKSLPLVAENGFAGVAPLSGLTPNTHYRYALTLSDRPPTPDQAPFPRFTTFPPNQQKESFSFAFGSCFRPVDENGGQIFRALDRLRQSENLRFIMLIGDQIYADAYQYNGIGKIACDLDEYRQVYAYTWSRPPLRQLLANLPAFMTLDDHEVDDDWRWLDSDRRWAYIPWWDQVQRWLAARPPQERYIPLKRVQDALQAYWEHQGMHAPHFELPPVVNEAGQYALPKSDPGSLAYTFTFGAAAFFVLDTRTMRVRFRRQRSMLGEGQWKALEAWLLHVKDTYPVKFLVTSCALLYNMWLDIPRDRWSGFPQERDRLLNFLAANGIEDVYLLAGDLHSAHAVHAELYGPQEKGLPLWEFCSTPFEQVPSSVTRRTYSAPRVSAIKKQELIFTVAEHNFGVVRVDFGSGSGSSSKPKVRFEIYGTNGDMLAQTGSE
jgi:alkaline phosphatase D